MTSRYVFQTEFSSGSVAFLHFLMLTKKCFSSKSCLLSPMILIFNHLFLSLRSLRKYEPLETSENLQLFYVFGGYRSRTLTENG